MAKRYRSMPSGASGTVQIDWESFARSFRKIRLKRYSRPENDARHAPAGDGRQLSMMRKTMPSGCDPTGG
jgi:hypothetical protein